MSEQTYVAALPRFVRVEKYCQMTGMTRDAIKHKRANGQWLEGRELHLAPEGKWWVDWQAADRYVLGENL